MGRVASLARSTGRPRRRPGPPRPEAKLERGGLLLRSEDADSGAARALEWLAEHVPVSQGLCLVVDESLDRLVTLVGLGVSPAQARQVSVGLDAREHPLVAALAGDR